MLGSGAFSRWLSRQFHQSRGKPPRAQALQEAIGLLEAKAQFESPEIPVWVRVAEHGGLIYIDLCNSAWEVVEIGELYTDSDEIIFDAMRPVTLNGIDHLAERADLAERALILHMPRIAPNDRQDERQLYANFERELPLILGALYTALGVALSRIDHVCLGSKPRMADFALWATAAGPGLGVDPNTFLAAYHGNRAEAVEDTLEGDVVAAAVLEWMDGRRTEDGADLWEGTCKQLLQYLESTASEGTKKSPAWPKTPRELSSRLRRIATFLREVGIEITFHPKGARGQRLLSISEIVQTAATATTASDNTSDSGYQSDGTRSPSGNRESGVADEPPAQHQPPAADAAAKSLNGIVHASTVAVEAVMAVVCSDSNLPVCKNLCATCGPVDWIWDGTAWACPRCNQPARS
jgi:hypothetical protein